MIACLTIPYFAAAVERRADDSLTPKPLAIGGQPWEAKPIYAFSQEVARQGVNAGMSLRLVQVLSPDSHFVPAHKPAYGRVSAEVTDVLLDFSPDVEPQELWHSFADSTLHFTAHGRTLPARYCLDLDGLPLSEAVPFMQDMGKQLRAETSFAPTIGLSADKFTAQVAATFSRPNHLLSVEGENHAQFLSSRPLAFLPLDKEAARRLHLMGIRTLGQFAALPLPALQEQFGSQITYFYLQAQGQGDEPIQTQPAAQQEEIRQWFDEPVDNLLSLMAVLTNMVNELTRRLQTAVLAGRSWQVALELADGRTQQQSLTLRQPTAEAHPITTALQATIASLNLTCGVTAVTLTASDLTPATAQQLTLIQDVAEATASVAVSRLQQTVQNLTAKYKDGRFYQPILTENHHPLPERRFQLRPFAYDPALA
jgi:nucleotidyltransferase/DNA polymerase involved in DNA repair